MTTLNNIKVGEGAKIKEIRTDEAMRRRLLDIGLIENTYVNCIGKSPCNDPRAYLIRGAVIALRCDDAMRITVKL